MKLKNILAALLIFITSAGILHSQNVTKTGTTAAQFLKVGIGGKGVGMGSAVVASVNDISAMYWNPGGLARLNENGAIFSHTDWLLDISIDYAGVALNVPDFGTVGAFVSVLSMGDMDVRTVNKPEGTGEKFGAGGLSIGLSYARNLTDNFSIGFNAKYIREFIWNSSATGFAADVGIMYTIPFLNETRLGASISNFGTKMKLEGRDILLLTGVGPGGENIINTIYQLDEYDLPLLFRFGVAVDAIKQSSSRLTIEANAIHPNDNTEAVNIGAEYSWKEILFARAGYNSAFEKDSEKGFTLGLGVKYRVLAMLGLNLDYAYQTYNRLKDVHCLTLGVNF